MQAVLTADDVPGRNLHGIVTLDWPVLCADKVRYTGDAVAIVAADSEAIAEHALGLIRVEYEDLEAVTSAMDALKPGAPRLHDEHPDGNLLKHIKVRKGDMAEGFAAADVIIDRTYRTPTTEHLFLEPECAIGVPAGYNPADFGGPSIRKPHVVKRPSTTRPRSMSAARSLISTVTRRPQRWVWKTTRCG